MVSYERNTLTNERLEAAGIEVIRVPGGELAGCRGGPRAMSCPVSREPAMMPEPGSERLAAVPAPQALRRPGRVRRLISSLFRAAHQAGCVPSAARAR